MPTDDPVTASLERRTWDLLQPGEVDLNGCIVHTEYDGSTDLEMTQATIDIGERIAERAGHDPSDTFVYSGSDDPEFASNQHQGLTLDDESFIWECQQLLREGAFDLVFYYEAAADHEGILADVREAGYEATGVRGDAPAPGEA
jgi:hypothetical protein